MSAPPPPVRGLEDARRVARSSAGPIRYRSDVGAAASMGPGWWRALTDAIAGEFPDREVVAILDCADDAGRVLESIRAGVRDIAFAGGAEVAGKLEEMARLVGARLHRPVAPTADPEG